jgi:hypothetical protein
MAAKLLFLTPVVVIFDSSIGAASPSLSLSLGQQGNIPYPAVTSIYLTSVAHESVRRGIEPDLNSVSPGRVQTLL